MRKKKISDKIKNYLIDKFSKKYYLYIIKKFI